MLTYSYRPCVAYVPLFCIWSTHKNLPVSVHALSQQLDMLRTMCCSESLFIGAS